MIDFSTLQGLTIPEGVVTQIADASGRVLWKYSSAPAPATVAVTMQSDLPSEGSSTIMGIGYHTADGSYYDISSAGTYSLPVGTVIDFWIGPEKGSGSAAIYVNDEYVTGSRDGEKCSYYHTLTTNITISVSTGSGYGAFYITTEVGSEPSMVTITLEGIAQSYVEIGDDYYRWEDITVEVPSGTVVRCCNASSENRDKESWIYHNDTMVVDGMGFYEFTATKNTTIRESSWKSDYGTYSVGVYITEVPVAFTIDSTTYFAEETMTWAEWFASSHNTTGKTADDVSTITDSNGNTVNLTDIIVNGTAYEVGFGPATATITLNGKGNGWYHYVKHNRTIYSNATNTPSFQANIGDVIVCHCMLTGGEMSIYLNGILVAGKTGGTMAVDYSYTVVSDATIELAQSDEYRRIIITEL